MSFSLVHLSDPHFGRDADIAQVEAIEALVPDLEPDAIVLSGDLTQRARHGEFQRARAWARELGRTAPVYVLPGNHDVQWWWRPFVPFGSAAKYGKYRRYFGPVLAPTLDLPGAVIAGVVTAHGVSWGSLTSRLRDIAVKGHLPRREIRRAADVLSRARPEQARILVVHHNILRGRLSARMGLARWRGAQRRIVASGADLVLCGHDHQELVDALDGVVVACAGTLCTRSRGGSPSVFFRVTIADEAIQVEQYRWDAAQGGFKQSDKHQFARRPREPAIPEEAAQREA
ncbi:MAG TPA: metallophosphoesterase [Gemmatimonadales bacterium]|nr:metallophosphoesterase [Gemmatimonadales bacterium]